MWKIRNTLQAEAEAETAAAAGPVGDDADSDLWGDLFTDDDEAVVAAPGEQPEVVTEAVGEEAEPEVAPPVVAEAAPTTPEPPVAEMKPEAVSQPPAPPVSPEVPQPPQEQFTTEQIASWRQQVLGGLEQVYALDSDTASALQVEPEKVLPKLAATLHMQIYDQVMRAVAAGAPAFIEQTMSQKTAAQKAEDAFYARWQNLQGHRQQVNEVARMWRQMYPNASLEEAIQGVGEAAQALLGISAAPPPPTPNPPPTPARPSSRTVTHQAQSNLSPQEQMFRGLAEEFLTEEL
jgi:hypothetical protein